MGSPDPCGRALVLRRAVFFANRVPPKARDAYRKDAMSGILGAVMMGLTGPFVGVIARKTLNASSFEIAVLSMAPVAGHLFALVWANVMEGRPKMPFAMWSWIVSRSLFFLTPLAQAPGRFVGLISTQNFVASVASPAYSAIMKEVYPDSDRGRIMGYARVCTIGMYVIVTAIAAPLLKGSNYVYVFPIAGVFGVVSAVWFSRIHSADASGDSDVSPTEYIHGGLLILRDDPGFRWFCAGIFMFGFANFMATPLYVIRQVDIGVDTQWAGVYSMVAAIIMTVSYFYWGPCIDKRRPEAVVAVQAAFWALIPLIYCMASRPWMLLPSTLISGVMGAGAELSYFTGVLHFAPKDRITQYQGVFLSLMGVRGIVAPLLGAALERSVLPMKGVFVLSAAMILVSVVIQIVGMRKYGALAEARR